MRPGPPLSGPVRWLLRLLLPDPDHRTLLSELEEAYELRRAREGDQEARSRLRREGRRAVLHAATARLRDAARPSLSGLPADLAHGARRLTRAPGFTLAVALTVALGLGGTTAMFAVVHGVLVKPLPYPEPHQLVHIYTEIPDQNWNFSMVDVQALSEHQTTFEGVAFMTRRSATLSRAEGAEQLTIRRVTPGFFPLLGLEPALGRAFTESEGETGAGPVAVVSHDFWRARLGGDPGILERTLALDGEAVPVVGVLPPRAGPLTADADLLLPLAIRTPDRKGPFSYLALGRVREEMRGTAAEELAAIEDRIFPEWRDSWPRPEATWVTRELKAAVVGDTGPALWIMTGVVGLLLLIACANTANLLVARGLERRRELAVRTALGASRGRLLAHLLAESAVLAALGAVGGLALAAGGIRLVRTLGPDFLPRTGEVALTPPVLLFLAGATAGSLLLFGLVPALQSSGVRPARRLRAGGRFGTEDGGARRLRSALVAGQFAVTAPLLVGAGLLLASLERLRGVDPGFDPERTVAARLVLPPGSYPDSASQRAAWERLADRVRELPGVEAAGVGTGRPPDSPAFGNNFVLEDVPLAAGEAQPVSAWVIAEPGYFQALEMDVVEGRMFDGRTDPPRVLLVDRSWARRFFPSGSPVGRRIRHGACTLPSCPPWTVIGVVEDVRYTGLDDAGEGTVFLNFQRWPGPTAFLVARAGTDRAAPLLPVLRATLTEEEPGAPVTELATGEELLHGSLREPRYLGVLVAGFGALALALALVGIYGIMSYFVEERRRDMGIRLALGGTPRSVVALVLGRGMRLALVGTLLGLVLGLLLSGFLESVLFGVERDDPASYAVVATLMVGVALGASWAPALRAARLDPSEALRGE